jgi:hypothetical protein
VTSRLTPTASAAIPLPIIAIPLFDFAVRYRQCAALETSFSAELGGSGGAQYSTAQP